MRSMVLAVLVLSLLAATALAGGLRSLQGFDDCDAAKERCLHWCSEQGKECVGSEACKRCPTAPTRSCWIVPAGCSPYQRFGGGAQFLPNGAIHVGEGNAN